MSWHNPRWRSLMLDAFSTSDQRVWVTTIASVGNWVEELGYQDAADGLWQAMIGHIGHQPIESDYVLDIWLAEKVTQREAKVSLLLDVGPQSMRPRFYPQPGDVL